MGVKFANLQINCNDINTVNNCCPHNTVVQFVENWITVFGEKITWGTAQKEAKRLSKLLPYPILSTEYFDDDYVEFSVYKDGKIVAKHIPVSYEGFRRKIGKPVQFIEAFSLCEENADRLKVIFQETDPEICVHLLECILKCIIWVDQDNISNATRPPSTFLAEYLTNKKQKIKNATKLVLLDEVSGDFDDELTYPIVRYETPTGESKSIWIISSDKHLSELFHIELKGRIATNSANVNSDKMFLLTVNEWCSKNATSIMYAFDYKGNITEKVFCEDNIPRKASLLNEDLLFYNGKCYDFLTRQIRWDWNLENNPYGIERICKISDNKYVAIYDLNHNDAKKAYIVVFNVDGLIQHSIELPSVYHWKFPVVYDRKIYIACGINKSESVICCYDDNLKEQWNISYSGIYHYALPFFDQENDTLYYQATAFSIYSFSLNERCIRAKRNIFDCYAMPLDVFPGIGLIAMTGDNAFEVWNRELKTISRHRTKGDIMRMVHLNDNHYILSNRHGDWETVNNCEKYHTGSIQAYELKRL